MTYNQDQLFVKTNANLNFMDNFSDNYEDFRLSLKGQKRKDRLFRFCQVDWSKDRSDQYRGSNTED